MVAMRGGKRGGIRGGMRVLRGALPDATRGKTQAKTVIYSSLLHTWCNLHAQHCRMDLDVNTKNNKIWQTHMSP